MRRIITPVAARRGGVPRASLRRCGAGAAAARSVAGERNRREREGGSRQLWAGERRGARASPAARKSRGGPETEARPSTSNRGGGAIWKDAASPAVRRVGAEVSGPSGSRERRRGVSPSNSRAGDYERLFTERDFGRWDGSRAGLATSASGGAGEACSEGGARRPRALGRRARMRLPSSITSASPAILALPRPEALRPEIAPGVLLSVIVDRCCEHRHRSKKQAIQDLDGFQPVAGRLIGVRCGNFSPRELFFSDAVSAVSVASGSARRVRWAPAGRSRARF
jgi:hypothetical protein